jgi:hypothetical protein
MCYAKRLMRISLQFKIHSAMETLIIKSDDKNTLDKIKKYLKDLKVSFKTETTPNEDDSPYDPEFVKMVLERAKSAREGNTVTYTAELRKELFGK